MSTDNGVTVYSKRQHLELLRAQLDNERSSFKSHWRDLGDYILPRRGRFFTSDVNKGDRRSNKIIDGSPTLSARTLRSGMMSGVTSPARPWFRLTLGDADLSELGPVKDWLSTVGSRMSTVFLKSNLYNVLPTIYGDLGVFGTAAMYVEEDFSGDVMRFYPFPIGSYMIGNDDKLKVNIFFREFRMTVRQIVQKFGYDEKTNKIDWSGISDSVKNLYQTKQSEAWVDVVHAIVPNDDYDPKKVEAKFKKYYSVYYEQGITGSNSGSMGGIDQDKFLRESGYDYFPVLCPRWETTGEDVYGTECPGMSALGDIKQLQTAEKRTAQAIEKKINPPMTAPVSMRNQKASILPGDITYVDVREGQQGFRAAHAVDFSINEMEAKQQQVRQRISRAFFEDLFLMLAQSDRRQITAREIDERHEEKLLALGPVLEQLNQDLLDPLIDIAFSIMQKQGLIPEPPEEIQGQDLKIEYISIMAQAQKLLSLGAIDRFIGFAGNIIQANPETQDKIDADQLIDIYGEITSIPPGIIRPDDKVESIRAGRAQQQQAAQKQQQVQQMAMTAQQLSKTDMEGDNALSRILGR